MVNSARVDAFFAYFGMRAQTMKNIMKSFGSLLSKRARSLDNAHRPSAMSSGKGITSIRRENHIGKFPMEKIVEIVMIHVKISFENSSLYFNKLRIPINARSMCSGL
jgi:hypothetical protein